MQFVNTAHIYIAGVEFDGIGLTFDHTENATLHGVVVNGPKTAILLTKSIETNILFCKVKNTFSTGVHIQSTYNTTIANTCLQSIRGNGLHLFNTTHSEIRNTSIMSTKGDGIELEQADHTVVHSTSINDTQGHGIQVKSSNHTLIEQSQVNHTRWDGIEVYNATETTLMDIQCFAGSPWKQCFFTLLAITQPYYMLCTKCTYQNDQLSFLVKVIKLISNHVTVT